MPRKPRDQAAGGVYHVFARGNRREAVFRDDEDRQAYLSLFGGVATDCSWHPLAYCLMTNHVHHLIELSKPNLSSGMRLAHGRYARAFNEKHRTGGGHLFQKRFSSNRAPSEGTVMYFACYVLLNPVRAGICALPEQYPWSSCAATLATEAEPAWLDAGRLLQRFGSARGFRKILEAVRVMGAAGFEPPTSRV